MAPELVARAQFPPGVSAPLILTPHSAFYSDEAFVEMRHLSAREVRRVLRGEPAHYRVNA